MGNKTMAVAMAAIVTFTMLPALIEYVTNARETWDVSTEWHNNTDWPGVIQFDNYPVKDGTETIHAYNTTNGADFGELTKGTNYTVEDYDKGKFNITDLGSVKSDYNVNASVDYTWHETTYLESGGERAVTGLLVLFLFLGLSFGVARQMGVV